MLETTLITAIALVFIIEGFLPFLFPNAWRRMMKAVIEASRKRTAYYGVDFNHHWNGGFNVFK